MEAFLQYDASMANVMLGSDMSFGIFWKYSFLRAETTLDLERIVGNVPRTPAPYDLVYQRSLMTLGANAAPQFRHARFRKLFLDLPTTPFAAKPKSLSRKPRRPILACFFQKEFPSIRISPLDYLRDELAHCVELLNRANRAKSLP